MNSAVTKTDIPARNKVSEIDREKMLNQIESSFKEVDEDSFDLESLVLEFATYLPEAKFDISKLLTALCSSNKLDKEKALTLLSLKIDDTIPSYDARKTLAKIKSIIQ